MQHDDSGGLRTPQQSNISRKRDFSAKERPEYWQPLYPAEDQSSLVIREPPGAPLLNERASYPQFLYTPSLQQPLVYPLYIKSTISKDNTSADRTEVQEGLKSLGQRYGKRQVSALYFVDHHSAICLMVLSPS